MAQIIPAFQNALLELGLSLTKTSEHRRLDKKLRLIWPRQTEHDLVRIGSEAHADGGYLLPNDLDGIGRVFSPGVAQTMEFEKWFLDRGIPCEMIDGSVTQAPEQHPLAHFRSLWLGVESVGDTIGLDDWVQEAAQSDEDLILQIDIEGAEYGVILGAEAETLKRFRIIVIELHDLRAALSRAGSTLLEATLAKLARNHVIVHAHPNNCTPPLSYGGLVWPEVLELTLLRKDRVRALGGFAELPHQLDRDNTANPHFDLIAPQPQI